MIDSVSITTNGSLLTANKIVLLKNSGLDSITLSLDTLDEKKISLHDHHSCHVTFNFPEF